MLEIADFPMISLRRGADRGEMGPGVSNSGPNAFATLCSIREHAHSLKGAINILPGCLGWERIGRQLAFSGQVSLTSLLT